MRIKSVKILHCADLHIGDHEGIRTFETIISLCKDEKPAILLIAGDFFDRINVSANIFSTVISLISQLPDTVVAIAPGNHDPFSADSVYNIREWPENVIIFRDKLSSVILEDIGVRLWGCGFTSYYADELWQTESSENIESGDGYIEICVMHGDLAPQVSSSPYNLIPQEILKDFGFDYVALGHVHKRTPVMKAGRTFYSYSGCPYARGFDEPGDLGVYIGDVGKSSCELRFVKTNNRRYITEEIVIDSFGSNLLVSDRIIDLIRDKYPSSYAVDRFKIIVKGELPDGNMPDPFSVTDHLSKVLSDPRVEVKTIVRPDYEKLAGEGSLKGLFLGKMKARVESAGSEEERELALRALEYGLKAFEGEVKIDEDNVCLDR